MKDILYRKIFKALNEDLNMILSDDDFEEPEIDLGAHLQNIQNDINRKIIHNNILSLQQNNDFIGLKELIHNWDGQNPIFFAADDNIRYVVRFSIHALGSKANLNWIDTSQVTDMSDLFYRESFTGDISTWNVSNVTNMSLMFKECPFNGDISSWDVSSVTDMYGMFYESKFNGDISSWDVSNVTDMEKMFMSSPFNQDISSWNVSKVTNMAWMFAYSEFNQDINKWNIQNVIDMDYIFYSQSFKQNITWDLSHLSGEPYHMFMD